MFNNMPPFFLTFLSMMGFKFLDNAVSNTTTQNQPLALGSLGSNYSNFIPDLTIAKFIKIFESGSLTNNTYYRAYDAKDGLITIGNGSTLIVDNFGKTIRPVKNGDTLDIVKQLTKNTHLNNEEMAFKLTMNHLLYLSKPSYLKIANQLDLNNVPFSQNIATMIFETCYGSGSGLVNFSNSIVKNFINKMKFSQNDNQRVSACLEWRLRYYQSLTGLVNINGVKMTRWNAYKNGWTTRMLTLAMLFSKNITIDDIYTQKQFYERSRPKKIEHFKLYFGIDNIMI